MMAVNKVNVIYKSPVNQQTRVLSYTLQNSSTIYGDELKQVILHHENLPPVLDLTLQYNGKWVGSTTMIKPNDDLYVCATLPIVGGKGGFGSMLRAIGAQIEKTTNREACRDLSGRRLRDVNEEKRIKEWIKKQADKKRDEEKKKKEKLKRLAEMSVPASCQYNDPEFEEIRNEIPDIVEESINYALQNTVVTTGVKRKISDTEDDCAASTSTSSSSSSVTVTEGQTDDLSQASSSSKSSKEKKVVVVAVEKAVTITSTAPTKDIKKPAVKKQALWLGVDIDSSSDESDHDQEEKEKVAKD